MPIPQTAPHIVGDPLSYPVPQRVLGNPGPYLARDGSRYIFSTEIFTDGTYGLIAYKSIDGGTVYTRITATIKCYSPSTTCIFYPGTGDLVYFGFIDPADATIKFVFLDMITIGGVFGHIRVSPFFPAGGMAAVGTLWIVISGLTAYMAWDDAAGINVVYWNGASWSGLTTLTGVGNQLRPMTALASGRAGIWSCDTAALGDAGSGKFYFTVMNGATVVASHTALTLPSGDDRAVNQYAYSGYYDATSNSSVLALPMFKHSTGNRYQALLIAHPSLTPTFTLKSVDTFNATDTIGSPWLSGNSIGNAFGLFWYRRRASDSEDLVEYATATSLTGTWGSAATYYDEQAHLPTPTPPAFNGIFPVTANVLSNGTTGVIVGLRQTVTGPTQTFDGILYTWIPIILTPTPPTPTPTQRLILQAQVSGGAAVPANWTVSAVGPSTIVGVGSVNSTVPVGTFTLAETTLAGYTNGSYVCVGGTQVGNQITLASGQSATCTIINTFNAGPPVPPLPPPPPPPDVLSLACPVSPGNTGVAGRAFSAQMIVSGEVPPFTFAITAGSLPPGLTLNTTTGVISGTPTATGTFSFTISVVES